MKINIVWFRSDLRVYDNPALSAALSSKPLQPVRAVFFITEQQWLAHNWGHNKIGFVLQNLLVLQKELGKLNISLDLMDCTDFKSQPQALLAYMLQYQGTALYLNIEYELNESQRDQKVIDLLKINKINTHQFHDQTLIQPGLILTTQNRPYTVFTPFKKNCYNYLGAQKITLYPKPKRQSLDSSHTASKNILATNYKKYLNNPILAQWPSDQKHCANILQDFCAGAIETYQEQRDFPAAGGTSKLSPYLAIGTISAKQCYLAAINVNQLEFVGGNANISCWINELLWRDFYRNIIFHFPRLCKNQNFNRKYDQLKWQPATENLALWQKGQTGIPIVDAAMRQLVATGWMHNRLRMIVAMFLTKNLLIDWRYGEEFFSQHLIDLDFASNNGGWQWSASTGTDAVPYFRVFNPITQSAKFDPQGIFIKQYCPELLGLTAKQIHNPSASLTQTELIKINYSLPIIDIKQSRARALKCFGAIV